MNEFKKKYLYPVICNIAMSWWCGVGRGCDPLRLMSNAFLYTTKS